jgi:DNA-binding phage protein
MRETKRGRANAKSFSGWCFYQVARVAAVHQPPHRVNEDHVRRHLVRNIRMRMDKAGMSVEQLAGLAAVSRAQTYRVFRHESNPSLRWIVRVGEALGCPASELLRAR